MMLDYKKRDMAEHGQAPNDSEPGRAGIKKAITLHLRPEVASGLESLADALGSSVEQYLMQLVGQGLSLNAPEEALSRESGLVWENGLLVYRTGNPLPAHVVADAVRRSRNERLERITDDPS